MSSASSGSTETPVPTNPRRKILTNAVGGILQESGFTSAEKAAVGTLTEMLQSLICEIGRSAKAYCELAYRAEPVIGDIVMALVDMGISIDGLPAYGRRQNRVVIPPPGMTVEHKQHNVLQVGDKKQHPQYIPDHLPPFPDTHTYCFSHTHKQPVTEYEAIREKSAVQKKEIERALTKFAAKTNETLNLFFVDDKEYLLVGVKKNSKPYIDALMPRDQVFEEEEEATRDRERKRRKQQAEEGEDEKDKDKLNESQDQELDNPFLRPVKMPMKVKLNK